MIAKELEGELVDGYRRRSAITDALLAEFRAAYETERGCVADQPQHSRTSNPLRLVEDDTAALRSKMNSPGTCRITKEDIFY